MRAITSSILLAASLLASPGGAWNAGAGDPDSARIIQAFTGQGIRINQAEAQGVRSDVLLALEEIRKHGQGNSKVDFAAVQIARDLGLETRAGSATVKRIVSALAGLSRWPDRPGLGWEAYFDETTGLWDRPDFMELMDRNRFHPVKISWEDIGRDENSAWGDRISDVGIWVRRDEADPASARLALSVRRDSNFRDKVLMVPADRIKIHTKVRGTVVERTLPQRLQELGLASRNRDRNVIVSNQFAIVPVPSRDMRGGREGVPPRAAFTFSIYPYGSTNVVITDVIEGSHEAVVGPGGHQLLFANVDGRKAPFTASRAEDRQDLLQMERDLKAKGMDVDVQRYYLIQIPLRRDVPGIRLSSMGTPPMPRLHPYPTCVEEAMPAPAPGIYYKSKPAQKGEASLGASGLDRVAIGHGEAEGAYFAGSGCRGARAEEPIRVTVVYFVTPVGRITDKDMDTFARAFASWDSKAIWGGSFVTKESD